MENQVTALSWRPLDESDLPAVSDLARACLAADGGQPFAADPGFLRRCYRSGAESLAGFDGAALVCVSSLRGPPATSNPAAPVTMPRT